jgi:hypothetical protein
MVSEPLTITVNGLNSLMLQPQENSFFTKILMHSNIHDKLKDLETRRSPYDVGFISTTTSLVCSGLLLRLLFSRSGLCGDKRTGSHPDIHVAYWRGGPNRVVFRITLRKIEFG